MGDSEKYYFKQVSVQKLNQFIFLLSSLFVHMQCFHWNGQAGNYAFLESRDQCLHGRLGSDASYRPVGESR